MMRLFNRNTETKEQSNRATCKRSVAVFLLLCSSVLWFDVTHAQPLTPENKFPRTANVYLSTIQRSDYDRLAQYDLLVLIPEIQHYNPDFFSYARAKNPHIIILPYIYSSHVNIQGQDDIYSSLKRDFAALATGGRYLYNPERNKIDIWNNVLFLMNPTTDWVEVMPQLVKEKILSTGLWDGIFYDVFDASITHFGAGNIDIDNDGVRDDPTILNTQWQKGMTKLLANTRTIIGDNYYMVINGDSLAAYQPNVNGRMFESFPTPWEGRGRWQDTMRSYLTLLKLNRAPASTIINTNTRDKGSQRDYQRMRFGLGSTLLGSGYSSFDFGESSHAQLWYYDEYKTFLGRPVSAPVNTLSPTAEIPGPSSAEASAGRQARNDAVTNSLWRRDFEQGVVFVNSSDRPHDITLDEEFEKMHGTQDPAVNDGSITNTLSLAANDGILLLRPIDRVTGSPFPNGSFARVFLATGDVKRTGFFTYQSAFRGRSTVAELTLTQSNSIRYVVAEDSTLTFFDADKKPVHRVSPYGDRFPGTFTFALADLDHDGRPEVLTVPTSRGSVHVRAFQLDGRPTGVNFIANKKNGSSGSIAVVPGPKPLIVLGARVNERPIVALYDLNGKRIAQWGAFEGSFLGGVTVAVGDVEGNGTSKIVVGRGAGGGAEVRIFTPEGKLTGLFTAFDTNSRGGVNVLTSDIDHDGRAEILALTTKIFTISGK